MKWSRKNNVISWKLVTIDIDIFVEFVRWFRRTAPGVCSDMSRTPEMNAERHKDVAKDILEILQRIKNSDVRAYRAMAYLYKDDIRDAIVVYQESKGKV